MSTRLYRSKYNRYIGGVSGGLGEYFNIDPVIIRIIFFIAFIGWGTGLLAYIILWIFVPSNPYQDVRTLESDPNKNDKSQFNKNAGTVLGAGLVLIGFALLVENFFPLLEWSYVWPILLIGLGGYILFHQRSKNIEGENINEI